MERMNRIGILGGTFDPPHLGHLVLASEAIDQLNLERILWVLTPYPPHKRERDIIAMEYRLEMLQIATGDTPGFHISTVDIDRQPPHYALDTICILKEQHPNAELIYLIGGDSLHDLPTWHRPQALLEICNAFGVMRRPSDGVNLSTLEAEIPGITSKILEIKAPLLEISSTDIRERISLGRPFRYFLPPGVYDLIRGRRLYGFEG
jgi:nicotinate-nucleotide adenylyltransferase